MQKTLYAGDTLKAVITSSDYPATDDWTLKVRFAPQGAGTAVTVDAAADNDGYVLTVPAATTADWGVGNWTYMQYVEKSGERYTIATGQITVQADPVEAAQGIDTRSHVKKTLDALEAVIEGKAGKDVLSYSINGRSLQHYPITELLKMRDKYRAEYAREQQAASGQPRFGKKIHVRM